LYPPQPISSLQFYIAAHFCQPDSLYPEDGNSISSEKLEHSYKNKMSELRILKYVNLHCHEKLRTQK
jgi:hypothetical protein